jgi:hypothetical protein
MRPRSPSYVDEGMTPRAPKIEATMRARTPSQVEDLVGPMRPQAVTVDDATHEDVRRSVKLRRTKDTIREHDDEDTPQAPQRSPLRAIVSS